MICGALKSIWSGVCQIFLELGLKYTVARTKG
jgi:hypothetical protein